MNYRQALKVKKGDVLKPRTYTWDFNIYGGVFGKREGTVSAIDNNKLDKKVVFQFEDGRKFEHSEIYKVVE